MYFYSCSHLERSIYTSVFWFQHNRLVYLTNWNLQETWVEGPWLQKELASTISLRASSILKPYSNFSFGGLKSHRGSTNLYMAMPKSTMYIFSSLRSETDKDASFPLTLRIFFPNPFFYHERSYILQTLDLWRNLSSSTPPCADLNNPRPPGVTKQFQSLNILALV